MRKPARSEHIEQVELVARVRHFHPGTLVFAIPNGGARLKQEAVRLKAEGVLAGVPDLLVPEPRGPYHGLFVEMKRVGGKATADQHRLIRGLRKRGYCVLLGDRGSDHAFALVEDYLALPSHQCPAGAPAAVYTDDSTDPLG